MRLSQEKTPPSSSYPIPTMSLRSESNDCLISKQLRVRRQKCQCELIIDSLATAQRRLLEASP